MTDFDSAYIFPTYAQCKFYWDNTHKNTLNWFFLDGIMSESKLAIENLVRHSLALWPTNISRRFWKSRLPEPLDR